MNFVTWPVVGLVLGFVGMFVFRTPISQLIGRTQKIGKDLLQASPHTQPVLAADEKVAVDELLRSYDNALLIDQEQVIRDDLSNRGIAGKQDVEKVLIRALAATQILAHFERTYSVIWDSQLALLRHLNTLELGMSDEDVADYFNGVVQRHPSLKELQTLDSYLGYLSTSNLLILSGGRVKLTIAGREFLKWLIEAGKPDRGVY